MRHTVGGAPPGGVRGGGARRGGGYGSHRLWSYHIRTRHDLWHHWVCGETKQLSNTHQAEAMR